MNIEDIKHLMDSFDPAALLPDLTTLSGKIELICRIAVLLGPVLLLILGLLYWFLAPKEANHRFGYRCYYGMGSVEAWRYTQHLAGIVWSGLGAALTLIMLIASVSFRSKPIMDQVGGAVTCLSWEAGLILASVLAINVMVGRSFDKDGRRRFQGNSSK